MQVIKSVTVDIVLSCVSWQVAQNIVDSLLDKHHIECAEFIDVNSGNVLNDQTHNARKIKVIMLAQNNKILAIKKEIQRNDPKGISNLEILPSNGLFNDSPRLLTVSPAR